MRRSLEARIRTDLAKKMVLITGPRQVGKTWLAKRIVRQYERPAYLNYDDFDDREVIEHRSWYEDTDLLVLDEVHKMAGWKRYLKGVYDTRPAGMHILVTGSARLDTFRQSGDALTGRYFRHRLLPFSLAELGGSELEGDLDRLVERGGFPEPLLAQNPVDADRWRLQYQDSLIRTDVLDLGRVSEIRKMELLLQILQRRTGSLLSYNSLARDLGVSPPTAKTYVEILEALFIVFRVTPHSRNVARAVLKSPKLYFYDTGMVRGDDGTRLENAVAVSLLKDACARTDETGKRHTLHYLRTKEGKEVDFCLCEEGALRELLEVKASDTQVTPSLRYFHERLGVRSTQLVGTAKRSLTKDGIHVRPAASYLKELFR
jgi:uncharacterized protein